MKKEIPGYEGIYEIDEYGNVFSIKRNIERKSFVSSSGYHRIHLSKNNIVFTAAIHRLVAQTFINNEKNLPQVNHIDGDKSNNHVSNLEWCTGEENIRHAVLNNLMKKGCGYLAKHISTGETREFMSAKEAEKHGFDSSTISKCCKGLRSKHKDYTWSYRTAAE